MSLIFCILLLMFLAHLQCKLECICKYTHMTQSNNRKKYTRLSSFCIYEGRFNTCDQNESLFLVYLITIIVM